MVAKAPYISVIMPVYNSAQYLEESIESILHQTFTNFEFIILNDGSTDGSKEIIEKYTGVDDRIRLIDDFKNRGLIYRLNQGLQLAIGKYFARMDGDDISIPTRLEKQMNYLDKHTDISLCSAWFEFIGDKTGIRKVPIKNNEIKIALLDYCPISHPLLMIRRTCIDELGIKYAENAVDAEDYDLWTRFVEHLSFANIPEVLLKYRVHGSQVSSDNNIRQKTNSNVCKLRMLNYVRDFPDHRISEVIINPQIIDDLDLLEKVLYELEKLIEDNSRKAFFDEILLREYVRSKSNTLIRYFYQNKVKYSFKSLNEYMHTSQRFKQALAFSDSSKIWIKSLLQWRNPH